MAGKKIPKLLKLLYEAQGLDPDQESVLGRLTPHVPGIVTFADHCRTLPCHTDINCVLIFTDISGFTALCERYSVMSNAGIDKLTKVLNGYIGAIANVILGAEGDILKFAGDAILASRRVNAPEDLTTVEKVINCCVTIQEQFGEWKTELGITLGVKIGVACGQMRMVFLGNDQFRTYVETGQAITDVTKAEGHCMSGYVVLSPSTWEVCHKAKYEYELLDDQHVRILAIKDQPKLESTKMDSEAQEVHCLTVQCTALKMSFRKMFSGLVGKIETDTEQKSDKVTSPHTDTPPPSSAAANRGSGKRGILKLRSVAKQVKAMRLDEVLRLYVLPPVLKKIDANQPLEYLSEMRQVSIVFMNLALNETFDVTRLLQDIFQFVYSQTEAMHGCLNKVFLFDKGCTFLVIFGLPGYKQQRDCANALICSSSMRRILTNVHGVMHVSVGVTTGTTFCGVVGHKDRHEYSVIGSKVNMAARLMMHYPDKVTCDDVTFLLSRLKAPNFEELVTKKLKGLQNIGTIREYKESNIVTSTNIESVSQFEYPLLGRDIENKLFVTELQTLIEAPTNKKYKRNNHLVFAGIPGIGKTRLLAHIICTAEKTGIRVKSYSLKQENSFNQYFLVKQFVKMVLTSSGYSHQIEKEPKIIDTLIKTGYSTSLHRLNSVLSTNFQSEAGTKKSREVATEDILCCIVQMCAEQIGGIVIAVDDLQYMDTSSWGFFNQLSQVPNIVLVCTILPSALHNPPCQATLQFIDKKNVIVRDLGELEGKHMAALACQIMDVIRIPMELEKILKEVTCGVPSWCEFLLCDLVKEKEITILLDNGQSKNWVTMLSPKAEDICRAYVDRRPQSSTFFTNKTVEKLDTSNDGALSGLGCDIPKEKIAVFGPDVIPSKLSAPDFMKQLTISHLDSMPASEQLIVKCAAALGVSFARDMLESVLPKIQRVKARKCFKKLEQIGIFKCANTPTSCCDHLEQRPDDTTSRDNCFCSKTPTDLNQDLCDHMKFCNSLTQQAAYEMLMDSQRLELHVKAATYLEKKADEHRQHVPYYILGRAAPDEAESTELQSHIHINSRTQPSKNQIDDISLKYWQTSSKGPKCQTDDEYKDPLIQNLQVPTIRSTQMTVKEHLETLFPLYNMILYHWRAARRQQNVVDQLHEAISVAVAINKPCFALEMLTEMDHLVEKMEIEGDISSEAVLLLKARTKRLKSKAHHLIGEDVLAYKYLTEAAHLLGLKQPKNKLVTKLQYKKFKWHLTSNRKHQLKPCTQMSTEQGYCLADLYQLNKVLGNKQLSALNAVQLLHQVTHRVTLTNQVIEGYCAMMDHCHIQGKKKLQIALGKELLARCTVQHKYLTVENWRSLTGVYTSMCVISQQLGDTTLSIMSGKGAIDLAYKLNDMSFVEEVTPSLSMSYILANRSSECREFLAEACQKTNSGSARTWYLMCT